MASIRLSKIWPTRSPPRFASVDMQVGFGSNSIACRMEVPPSPPVSDPLAPGCAHRRLNAAAPAFPLTCARIRSISAGHLDAGNHRHSLATAHAALHIEVEHALQPLCPPHRRMGLDRPALGLWACPAIPPAHGGHLGAPAVVLRQHIVVAGEVHTWSGTCAARHAMKSSRSKTTCVVPSRYGVFLEHLHQAVDACRKAEAFEDLLHFLPSRFLQRWQSSQALRCIW